jgi:hypothetical protein
VAATRSFWGCGSAHRLWPRRLWVPKRTVVAGVAALAVAIGYGRAVGVDQLAGAQGMPAVAIGVATVL